MLEPTGWPDNPTHHDLLAWAWEAGKPHHPVVVNFSGHRSCRPGDRTFALAQLPPGG